VLASLYPAVTVVLARLVHHERMSRVQDAGIGAAILGVLLVAAG
jgi:drug/metabolite transporter (DMT)-like permease